MLVLIETCMNTENTLFITWMVGSVQIAYLGDMWHNQRKFVLNMGGGGGQDLCLNK